MAGVGELDVLGHRRQLLGLAQDLAALGHDQAEPDRVDGDGILPDDQALVSPDVAPAEVMGPAAVELRRQDAQDVEPRLALDDRELE